VVWLVAVKQPAVELAWEVAGILVLLVLVDEQREQIHRRQQPHLGHPAVVTVSAPAPPIAIRPPTRGQLSR
jgi:hypothetical protein